MPALPINLAMLLALSCLFSCEPATLDQPGNETEPPGLADAVIDWTTRQDRHRLLENPDKGWFHHIYDNGGPIYGPEQPRDLFDFPGLDHVYVRIPWADLEPENDRYDWSLIDELVATYVPRSIGLAFAVTTKETSVPYGAPAWLRDLGVTMREFEEWNQTFYEPDYGHPVFLRELEQFQTAMAGRYAGAEWLRYVQIASYGSWGEGHNWPHSDENWPPEVLEAHIDIHLRAWGEELLTITDDWVGNARADGVADRMEAYITERRLSWAEHSTLVKWYVDTYPDTYGVRSPGLFAAAYPDRPVQTEMDHYFLIKRDDVWNAPDGQGGGLDFLKGTIRTLHATWVGYHGEPREFLRENPTTVREIGNLMGYRYTLNRSEIAPTATPGQAWPLSLEVYNLGVAPAYHPYQLVLQFSQNGQPVTELVLPDAGNKEWLPDTTVTAAYAPVIPSDLAPGTYEVSFQLLDAGRSGRSVDWALEEQYADDGFWRLGTVVVA